MTNPRIPITLLVASVVEAVVLAAVGGILFLAPGLGHDLWPWELTPFTTRFLGAVYLGSLTAVAALVVVGRWAPARVVVPMILGFTAVVLAVSLAYTSRFDAGRPATWAWFFLYVALPANCAWSLWRGRGTPPALARRPPPALRAALVVAAAALGGYGVLMLAAPGTATGFWPWPIDAFHGRLYSAVFLTLAIGAVLVAPAAAAVEEAVLGLTALVFGGFALAGLLVVDADVDRVDWSRGGTWVWVALHGAVLAGGAALVARAAAAARAPT